MCLSTVSWAAAANPRISSFLVLLRTAAMTGKMSPSAARNRSMNTRSMSSPRAVVISASHLRCSALGWSGSVTPSSVATELMISTNARYSLVRVPPMSRTFWSRPSRCAACAASCCQRLVCRIRTSRSRSAGPTAPLGLIVHSTEVPVDASQVSHVPRHVGIHRRGEVADHRVAGAGPNFGDGGKDLAVGRPEPVDEYPIERLTLRGGQLVEPALLLGCGHVRQIDAQLRATG